jgi:type I restriction enzyme S subunit
MSFPRYPAYKDSGVEWLGEVPEHWDYWRLSHAFGTTGSGTTPPSNEAQWYEQGTIPWVTTSELREGVITETVKCVTDGALRAFTALRIYPVGSLVIAMYGATIGRLGILGVAATTN